MMENGWAPNRRPHSRTRARVRACGICGTDLWLAHGTLKFREFPLVLGHEGVGEVAANCAGPTLTGVNVDGAHAEYAVAHGSGTVLLPGHFL